MRHPQLLIVEADGRLAALMGPVAEKERWRLRQPRRPEGCLRLLQRGGPGVVVVKVGRDLERELALVERVAWLCPDAAVVVVGDSAHAGLAGLAWDLGAASVLFPPESRELLPAVVGGLMGRFTGKA